MNAETQGLGRSSAGFAMSAAVTAIFNTLLAWAKDADRGLLNWMNAIAGHNWTTQGLADVILFVVLGLVFSRGSRVQRLAPGRLTAFLAIAVVASGLGLFAWYLAF